MSNSRFRIYNSQIHADGKPVIGAVIRCIETQYKVSPGGSYPVELLTFKATQEMEPGLTVDWEFSLSRSQFNDGSQFREEIAKHFPPGTYITPDANLLREAIVQHTKGAVPATHTTYEMTGDGLYYLGKQITTADMKIVGEDNYSYTVRGQVKGEEAPRYATVPKESLLAQTNWQNIVGSRTTDITTGAFLRKQWQALSANQKKQLESLRLIEERDKLNEKIGRSLS